MNTRKGFTLVEMAVVVVILSLLMALLLPALGAAITRAKVGAAYVEVTGLGTALATFKSRFGNEPPSTLILCENPNDWVAFPQHVATIRSLWPQYDFSAARDINNNGMANEQLTLDAAETLVFFLGGLADSNRQPIGFSVDPTNPFKLTGNRIGPFFEFDIARLTDADNDGFLEYHDKLSPAGSHPIVWYSSYEGQGYRPTELVYGMKDVYRITPAGANPPGYWKTSSYQIIAPGWDGELGKGGLYDANNPEFYINTGRMNEADNMTNFFVGTLRP